MGMGLPGAKRLMDDFSIQSQVGVGTKVVLRKWRN
jgi:serine/threonine-protein kinase RsbT